MRSIKYKSLVLFFILLGCFSRVPICLGEPAVSSTELIEHAKEYDGRAVVFEGEVIGEVMVRGGYAWVNVKDAPGAIGVWISRDMAKDIKYAGAYNVRGDSVSVRGVFNRACIAHGGDLDIHCLELKKKTQGQVFDDPVSPGKEKLIYILLGVMLCLLILRLSRKKQKPVSAK